MVSYEDTGGKVEEGLVNMNNSVRTSRLFRSRDEALVRLDLREK